MPSRKVLAEFAAWRASHALGGGEPRRQSPLAGCGRRLGTRAGFGPRCAASEWSGIAIATVAAQAGQPDADPFDLLCHLAFNAPVLTRRQRADRLKWQRVAMFNYLGPEAREILDDLTGNHNSRQRTNPVGAQRAKRFLKNTFGSCQRQRSIL
jgi:hypothetical protein